MRWLLIFFIFYITSSVVLSQCPNGTVQSHSKPNICYLFQYEPTDFYKASAICNQNQAFLTSIHDAFENSFIQNLLAPDFQSDNYWIGANDFVTGNWSWIDGTPFDFTDWDSTQPASIAGHDCGAVNRISGKWKSDNCYSSNAAVCIKYLSEAPTTNLPPPRSTPTPIQGCPNEWKYYNETGFCYFVKDNNYNPNSWADNEDWCFNQSSHLASIHSQDENDFITNMLSEVVTGACNAFQYAWIGLYSVTNLTTWRWTDDSPYYYQAWAPSYPNNSNYLTFCGLTRPVGCNRTWENGICSDPFRYAICKKRPS